MKLNLSYNHAGTNLVMSKNEYNVIMSALTPQAEVFHNKDAEKVIHVLRSAAHFDVWNDTVKCRFNWSELGGLITCLAAESYGTVLDFYTDASQDGKKCVGIVAGAD